jgi:hypothetical protein
MAIKTSFARWVAGAAVSAVGLWSISAFAAVPATLTQQGRILDATTGDPVSSKLKIVFNVYADAKGGTALWTEEQNITLDDGYFSAQLGSVTAIPATLFDGTVRYLGVTVGADDEMAPREAITSVPYAMNAAVADVAGSVPFTSLTGIPTVCDPGMYLTGFSDMGVKQCVAVPVLDCRIRYTAYTPSITSNNVGCDATSGYTVMVGGGCQASVPLTGSFQNICANSPVATGSVGATATLPPGGGIGIPVQTFCELGSYTNNWTCNTGATAGSIRAYATCCKPQ